MSREAVAEYFGKREQEAVRERPEKTLYGAKRKRYTYLKGALISPIGKSGKMCKKADENKKLDSKEIGLAIGLTLGKYFFKTDDLHYGYWTPDLKVDLANMPQAQEQHSEFIMSHIPKGVSAILDVGCGAGMLSSRLLGKGYKPDCVSPSSMLTKCARAVLGDRAHIYEGKFEDIQTEKKYDLILFSESYQYVNLKKSFEQSLRFLTPGGHILICDFFKTDAPGASALGGGHSLKEFYETAKTYRVAMLKDIDITKNTAPNLDLIDDIMKNVGQPIWTMILEYLDTNQPFLAKILRWKYKKKLEKMNYKYFSGERNGKNFEIFKAYRLILIKTA